ncbi:MAG: RNA-directed DNA polymerase [Planctomycetes bacterium]|nr:RNA-directed DNA polymerase [Planctomycetota bacterium]
MVPIINLYTPQVICLQETLLEDQPDPRMFRLYHSYRRYMGHGVAVYVHPTLPQSEVVLNSPLEAVACRVNFGTAYLTICSLYCPPDVPIADDDFFELINSLPGKKLITGDFNAHHTQWGSLRCNSRGEQIANILLQSNLCLLNNGRATRVDDRNGQMSCIDLSIASPEMQGMSWDVYDDSLGSDHFPICISYACDQFRPRVTEPKFNYKKADWAAYSRVANLELTGHTIDEKVTNLQNTILRTADLFIPKTTTNLDRRRVPWWTPDCRQALTKRNRRYRIFEKQPTQSNFIAYKKAKAEARRTIKRAKRENWQRFVSTVNRNTPSSQVWSTINVLNNKYARPPITTLEVAGRVIDDPVEVAHNLADHFAKVSSSANYDQRFRHHKRMAELQELDFAAEDVNSPYNKEFTMKELLLALKSCKGTSPGPSKISYQMLQHLSQENREVLLQLFNEIWVSRCFPVSWRFSHVIPIRKRAGRLTSPSSFRPIALTDCLCKVMERMVNKRLLFVLDAKGVLSEHQSGFRKYGSTLDHLVHLEHCIAETFARKHFMVGVFLDIEKAYDMTWRNGILQKLYAYGLRGNLPNFIKNFLSDRTFSVKLPYNVISDTFVQENGVPQGSVLSPTLFNIAINDVLSQAPIRNLKYSLYADDCAIWHSSANAQFSAGRIQLALESIQQ